MATTSDNGNAKDSMRQRLVMILVDKLLIALILIGAGLWSSQHLEIFKGEQARRTEIAASQAAFIQQQLSEFYWPLLFRLEKDNAVWVRILDKDKALASHIETDVILANHAEILHLLDAKAHLMFNPSEPVQDRLIEVIKLYVRHVAVYQALRAAGDTRWPGQAGEPWPEHFLDIVRKRIMELEQQRRALLLAAPPSAVPWLAR